MLIIPYKLSCHCSQTLITGEFTAVHRLLLIVLNKNLLLLLLLLLPIEIKIGNLIKEGGERYR